MEDLALLCTLHADGPATLRRLRRVGCETLEALEAYDADELAGVLSVPPAVARRLGREARTLSRRLDVGVFEDREEAPEYSGGGVETSIAVEGERALDRRDRAILDKVMERWENLPATARSARRPAGGIPPLVDVPAPAAALPEVVAGIAPGAIEGIDATLSARFAEHGIDTLSALTEATSTDVARALGLPFAQVRRLQFLARAALPVAPPEKIEEIEEEPEEAVEAVEPVPTGSRDHELRPAAVDGPRIGTAYVPSQEPASAPDDAAPFRPAWPTESGQGAPVADIEDAPPVEPPAEPVEDREPPPAPRERPEMRDIAAFPSTAPPELRKFWEPHPTWASGEAPPEPIQLPPEAPTDARDDPPRRKGATLAWQFEVATPPRRAAGAAPFSPAEDETGAEDPGAEGTDFHDGDAAGPFA